jgi:DNA-binding FadR family transcriptional regulator
MAVEENAPEPAGVSGLLGHTTRLTATHELMSRMGVAVQVGLLSPGERLPAMGEIAVTFGVSVTTVRRALSALAARGVLEARRGRNGGTFVANPPDLSRVGDLVPYRVHDGEVHHLLDQRRVLECGMAFLAAERASDAELDGLEGAVDAMDRATTWAEFRVHDPRFHLSIADMAGSGRAAAELASVLSRLVRFYVPYPIEYLHGSNDDHRELLGRLRARDAAGAAAVARRHVEAIYDTVFVSPAGLE